MHSDSLYSWMKDDPKIMKQEVSNIRNKVAKEAGFKDWENVIAIIEDDYPAFSKKEVMQDISKRLIIECLKNH